MIRELWKQAKGLQQVDAKVFDWANVVSLERGLEGMGVVSKPDCDLVVSVDVDDYMFGTYRWNYVLSRGGEVSDYFGTLMGYYRFGVGEGSSEGLVIPPSGLKDFGYNGDFVESANNTLREVVGYLHQNGFSEVNVFSLVEGQFNGLGVVPIFDRVPTEVVVPNSKLSLILSRS
jgi:hypothetical protein